MDAFGKIHVVELAIKKGTSIAYNRRVIKKETRYNRLLVFLTAE